MRIALGASVFLLTFTLNTRMGGWVLDVADANNNPLIYGVPILTGWPALGIFNKRLSGLPLGMLLAIDLSGNGADPQEFTFGSTVPFYYVEH